MNKLLAKIGLGEKMSKKMLLSAMTPLVGNLHKYHIKCRWPDC